MVAVLAFVGFLNGVLGWFGALVGIQGLTIELILGKVFVPLAWVMGTPTEVRFYTSHLQVIIGSILKFRAKLLR